MSSIFSSSPPPSNGGFGRRRRYRRRSKWSILVAFVLIGIRLLLLFHSPLHSGTGNYTPGPIQDTIVNDSNGVITAAKCPSNIPFNSTTTFKCDVTLSDGSASQITVSTTGNGAYSVDPNSLTTPS